MQKKVTNKLIVGSKIMLVGRYLDMVEHGCEELSEKESSVL